MATTQKTRNVLHRDFGEGWFGGGDGGRISDVIARGALKELEPQPAAVIKNAQERLKDGHGPLTFTDETTPGGFDVVRWDGEDEIGARRTFVDAVMERAGFGGEWFVVTSVRTAADDRAKASALVYCVDGEVVGLIAPYILAAEDGAG